MLDLTALLESKLCLLKFILNFNTLVNQSQMEEFELKFEDLCSKITQYESEAWEGICSLERVAFDGIEKGQKSLEITTTRLSQIDELITSAFEASPLSEKANARLMQVLVSLRPRLANYVEQLKTLLENPPKESLYPPIDDSEIFPKEENANDQKDESIPPSVSPTANEPEAIETIPSNDNIENSANTDHISNDSPEETIPGKITSDAVIQQNETTGSLQDN